MLELVLDPGDTFVTRVTAEAVLRRKDRIGLAVVASALAVADSHHSDWIHTAILDVFSIFSKDRDDAMKLCEEMMRDTDDSVSQGLVSCTKSWPRSTRSSPHLEETDAVTLKTIRNRCPEIDGLVGYVRRFASMAADLDGHLLDAWIVTTPISGLPPLASFARGLLADYDAVRNGLSLPFSSGAYEGNVNPRPHQNDQAADVRPREPRPPEGSRDPRALIESVTRRVG